MLTTLRYLSVRQQEAEMVTPKRLTSIAVVAALTIVGIAALPQEAKAWWRGGVWVPSVVIGSPVIVAPPRVYYSRPPVVVYGPPPPGYYYPLRRRVWVPPHWAGPYWVRGHWY
jgi:hypothetical protein